MNNTKLAVIMSIYKNDNLVFLKESLQSILEQDYINFAIFIMIDGHISLEVEDYIFSLKDSRINISKRIDNKGLAVSLNGLLKKVLQYDFKYIARMDADDISLQQRFTKQINFLDNNIDVDCVGTWAIEINENGDEYYRKKMPKTNIECFDFFKKRDCLIHPTVMFRRSYFGKAGFYPEDTYFGEDTMMWANGFANDCKFANIPEYLFKFRLDKNFFSRRRGFKHAKSIYILRKRVNRLLHYPISADIYALIYAVSKMMPTPILNLIYKTVR